MLKGIATIAVSHLRITTVLKPTDYMVHDYNKKGQNTSANMAHNFK